MAKSEMMDQLKDSPLGKIPIGVLQGVLHKDGKSLPNHLVIIQVRQDGEQVLTLPKTTDAQGRFEFKNIFRDPQFAYTLFTESDGKVYKLPPLTPSAAQEKYSVTFAVGPETLAGELSASETLPANSPRMAGPVKQAGEWQWHQLSAILLSCAVLIVLAYQWGKFRGCKR